MPLSDPMLNPGVSATCEPIPMSGTAEHSRYYIVLPTDVVIGLNGKKPQKGSDSKSYGNSGDSNCGCCDKLRFGVLVWFDQEWQDRGLSGGKIITSIFVPPGGEVQVSERSWQTIRSERSDTAQLDAAFSRSISVHDSDSNSVAKRTSFSKTRSKSGSFGIHIKGFSVGGQASSSSSFESSVDEARQMLIDETENAAWEEKKSRVSAVTVVSEAGRETTTVRTFRNPSVSKGVSYDYFELIQNYSVCTHELGTQLVLLVPRKCPLIDVDWLRCHEWILKPALRLDNASELFDEIRQAEMNPPLTSPSATLSDVELNRAVSILRELIQELLSPAPLGQTVDYFGMDMPEQLFYHPLYLSLKYAFSFYHGSTVTCLREAGRILSAVNWVVDATIYGRDWWSWDPLGKLQCQNLVNEIKIIYDTLVRLDTEEAAKNQQTQEQYKQWLEEKKRVDRALATLRCHIQEHLSHYLEIIWTAEAPDERACVVKRLYPDLMPNFWKAVKNELIGVTGNCMIMPLNDQVKRKKIEKIESKNISFALGEAVRTGYAILSKDTLEAGKEMLKGKDALNVDRWVQRALHEYDKYIPSSSKERITKEQLRGALTQIQRIIHLAKTKESDTTIRVFNQMIDEANRIIEKRAGVIRAIIKTSPKTARLAPGGNNEQEIVIDNTPKVARMKQYAQQLASSQYAYSIQESQNVLSSCRAIDSNALDVAKKEKNCIFIQLPSAGMLVEPRLTACDAWPDDVKENWKVASEKAKTENKLRDIKSQRHQARLDQDPPDLENPDCCKDSNLHVELTNVTPETP